MERLYFMKKKYKDTSVMTNILELTESSLSPIIAIVFQEGKPRLGHKFLKAKPYANEQKCKQ